MKEYQFVGRRIEVQGRLGTIYDCDPVMPPWKSRDGARWYLAYDCGDERHSRITTDFADIWKFA